MKWRLNFEIVSCLRHPFLRGSLSVEQQLSLESMINDLAYFHAQQSPKRPKIGNNLVYVSLKMYSTDLHCGVNKRFCKMTYIRV